jgi:DNA polymerase
MKNMTNNNKSEQLNILANQLKGLEGSPLYVHRIQNDYKPVLGEGNYDAECMFIGEAPGAQEAKTGLPFVGRAGKYLDRLLRSIGLQREMVYITNIVKDRPPGNRSPHVDEIKIYRPFLLKQISIIQPKVITTLGRFSMEFILDYFNHPYSNKTIGEIHGELLQASTQFGPIIIVPLYHPAAVFYNRSLEQAMFEDFQTLGALLRDP